jgi:hypothetical protein
MYKIGQTVVHKKHGPGKVITLPAGKVSERYIVLLADGKGISADVSELEPVSNES